MSFNEFNAVWVSLLHKVMGELCTACPDGYDHPPLGRGDDTEQVNGIHGAFVAVVYAVIPGAKGEKYAAAFLRNRGYIVDIHPRTSHMAAIGGKSFYISQENDYFNAFDLMGFSNDDIVLVQVTTMQEDASGLIIGDGRVAKRRDKIDKNFPVDNPNVNVLVFFAQKRWVKRDGERRHKEYFHRAWRREQKGSGTIWVERSFFSNLYSILD